MGLFSPDPTPVTQTTTQQLTAEQQKLLSLAMPGFENFAANPPKAYEGSAIPAFDPLQVQGQEQVLGATGGQQNVVGSAADASRFFTSGDVLNASSNPGLQSYMDAATRPIYNNLTDRVLPAVRGGSNQAGQFGGSRAAIAEALAARDAGVAAGDASAKIAGQAYGQGLDAMTKGLALSPQTAQALTIPGQTTSAVGDVRQNLERELLGEDVAKYNYEQMAPLLVAKELAGAAGSIPGGTTVSTGSPPQINKMAQTLGGAATGASIGSTFGPAGALAGGGIGAILPWL